MKILKLLFAHAYQHAFSHKPFWSLLKCQVQRSVPDNKTSSTCPRALASFCLLEANSITKNSWKRHVLRTRSHRGAHEEESA